MLAAVRKAVEEDPSDPELRVHLGSLLLGEGDAVGARVEAEKVLARAPDHVGALKVAESACQSLGDVDAANGYGRLLRALAGGEIQPRRGGSDDAPAPVRLHAVARVEGDVTDVERPALTLDDVGGMDQVKRRLRTAFLAPLENPALRRMYGMSLRGGMLLYGPPGCGKTFIARATAGQLGARFIGVSLHDVLDMWLGQSERNLHELFENARRQAPCVLFFDEVDALGRKRSQLRHSAGREVVVQFLSELDSFGADNEGVFVLAATNHPWDVDAALRRPGRLDRMALVLPPDQPAREAILEYHLRERPVGEVDISYLASVTDLYSGADLAHLCQSAAEFALEESIETGVARPLSMIDFDRALREVGPSTLAWLQTARNFAQFAGEGGAYDDLLEYLREKRLN